MNVDDAEKQCGAEDRPEPVTARILHESEHPIQEQMLDREALKVLYRLRDAGFKGYLVGGGVRDLYLGRTPKDFDVSTDARPGQLRQLFRNSRTIGRRFRLVQVFFRGNRIIEVSTLRSSSEFDLDDKTVLPSNNTFGTLEEDAFRRDLTINALFYEIENHTVIDYTGGVEDLERKIIRVVGQPDLRFTHDPVRMMRVVRHASRTGFTIEPETLAALHRHRDKLTLCPPSRIRDEILKDLQSGAACAWAELSMETTLWTALFPFYAPLLEGPDSKAVRTELLRVLTALDQLYPRTDGEDSARLAEFFLFAVLLMPWACHRFDLPATNVRGQRFHHLLEQIRNDVDLMFGQPFNVPRMAKDRLATLLINLSTVHHAREQQGQGGDPKWLQKKSYYKDCAQLYALWRASQGIAAIEPEQFIEEQPQRDAVEVIAPLPEAATGGAVPRSRGRGGNGRPAFSRERGGVFGFYHPRD
ncbi:MAG: polynucleotide adenylyltransferase PcnB [Desulfobulbus sp.]|jgi:poly(A) polymerase